MSIFNIGEGVGVYDRIFENDLLINISAKKKSPKNAVILQKKENGGLPFKQWQMLTLHLTRLAWCTYQISVQLVCYFLSNTTLIFGGQNKADFNNQQTVNDNEYKTGF